MGTILMALLAIAVAYAIGYAIQVRPYKEWIADRDSHSYVESPALMGFGTARVVFVVSAVIAPLVAIGGGSLAQPMKDYSYNLESLSDGTDINGSFFLGSGVIGNTPSFSYYVKREDGFHLESHVASKSVVVYTDGTPRIEYTCKDTEWRNFFFVAETKCYPDKYTFYVPEGSVKQSFNLDTQS